MKRTVRILRNSMRSMARNPVRTSFMVLATFTGICALTILLAIGRGTRQDLMQRVERMLGGSTMFVRAGGSRMVGGPHAGGTTATLKPDDLRALTDELDVVLLADPMVMAGRRDVQYEGRTRRIPVEGHAETAEQVWNRSVTRGAYFTADDVARGGTVALIGEVVARELFAGRDPIGEQIRIGAVPFQVIGIMEPVGIDPHGIDKDDEVVIPFTTMMRRVLDIDYVMAAKLALRPDADMDAAVLAVQGVLRRRHALAPDEPDDFHLFTPVQVNAMVRSTNRLFTLFLPLIAGISIAIGALVVANLMLMSVNDRRVEIGLRRAVGARAKDIRLQFLAEAIAVTGTGGVLALFIGAATLLVLAHVRATPPFMPWTVALLGLGTAVAVGIAAGVVPARRAAALDPVHTLR